MITLPCELLACPQFLAALLAVSVIHIAMLRRRLDNAEAFARAFAQQLAEARGHDENPKKL